MPHASGDEYVNALCAFATSLPEDGTSVEPAQSAESMLAAMKAQEFEFPRRGEHMPSGNKWEYDFLAMGKIKYAKLGEK